MAYLSKTQGDKIVKVLEITLTADAAKVSTLLPGVRFKLHNPSASDTAYIGPTANECLYGIEAGGRDGVYVVPPDGDLYVKGTANQKLIIMHIE